MEHAEQRPDTCRLAVSIRLDSVSLRPCPSIYDSAREADPITRLVEQETERTDPSWREHQKERWESPPADIVELADLLNHGQ